MKIVYGLMVEYDGIQFGWSAARFDTLFVTHPIRTRIPHEPQSTANKKETL